MDKDAVTQAWELFGQLDPIEDLTVAVLRQKMPDGVWVSCEIEENNPMPCLLVTATSNGLVRRHGNGSMLQACDMELWAYVEGIDAKQDSLRLCEVAREVLQAAWREAAQPVTGVYLHSVKVLEAPHRETDWAPAIGPVQYADLPQGFERAALQVRVAFRYRRAQAAS